MNIVIQLEIRVHTLIYTFSESMSTKCHKPEYGDHVIPRCTGAGVTGWTGRPATLQVAS